MLKAKTAKTKSARKFKIVPLLAVGIILLAFPFAYSLMKKPDCSEQYGVDLANVKLASSSEERFAIELADTIDERVMGLSGRDCIGENQAMLFSFELADKHSFWMKDMKFAIDIIWVDSDKKIIHIVDNATPASYPNSFSPPSAAQYVIEVKAGKSAQLGLEVGDTVQIL